MQIGRSKLFKEFFDKKNKREIKFLVLHHIADKTFEDAIAALKINKVSSHYIINFDGEIFQLVKEKDIAWHAGHSYWRGVDGLNKSSIGIEFYNSDPFKNKFSKKQIEAGIFLIKKIIKKYKIEPINIVGHSDIAYFPKNFHLDRKQDPSQLFPWNKLATNGIGLWPEIDKNFTDKILFREKDRNIKIKNLKQNLNDFGYKISNIDEIFDEQLSSVIRVFNLRFNSKFFAENGDNWYLSSDKILNYLLSC